MKVDFDPTAMRVAADVLDRHATESYAIVNDLLESNPYYGFVNKSDRDGIVRPRLLHIRGLVDRRAGQLMEAARFVRARGLLADLADDLQRDGGEVREGKAGELLLTSTRATVDGAEKGLREEARHMERAYLRDPWGTRSGAHNGQRLTATQIMRGLKTVGRSPSWDLVSDIAKKLPFSGKAVDVTKATVDVFHAKTGDERIKVISGAVGEYAGGAGMATAASLALLGGPPGIVGAVALTAAIIGGMGGKALGKYLGEHVVTPLWHGIEEGADALADGGKGLFNLIKSIG